MKLKLIAIVGLLALTGCDDPKKIAQHALDSAGFSNIETLGSAWFARGRDDWYRERFRATNPAGKTVTGAVCAGILKNATIRFD